LAMPCILLRAIASLFRRVEGAFKTLSPF